MPDRVDRGFEGIKRAGSPDLWRGIETRAPAPPPSGPGPLRRTAITVVAFCVAGAGFGLGYTALRDARNLPAPQELPPSPADASAVETPSVADGWRSYDDPGRGFSVRYPPDWNRAEGSLTPDLIDPIEILSLGTYPLRAGGPNCSQFPVNAIADLGPHDALISIQERIRGSLTGFPVRPASFGPHGEGDESPDCLDDPKEFSHWSIAFTDQGRGFHAYVAMGSNITERRQNDAWAILDSLVFDP